MNSASRITLGALIAVTALLAGCERPPVDVVQRGYRGTAMEVVYNPRTVEQIAAKNVVPAEIPAASPDGPKAKDIYQNVQLLGDLSVAEFTRHMAAITQWVAPEQGCVYCHNPANFAEDSKYTKVVARRMLQMTQTVNSKWQAHVAQTGVTCYTCHRGKPVPEQVWFTAPPQDRRADFIGDLAEQNQPAKSVGYASLPYDPYTYFFLKDYPIRVNGTEALPNGNRASIKQAEYTFGLMMHLSQALGVNCTYCHNTRSIHEWDKAQPQRVTAWHGIRMVRELNNEYLLPLTKTFPASRLGELGDVAKVNCGTCHQGAYKPLYGASMVKAHPELLRPSGAAAAAKVAAGSATADPVAAASAKPVAARGAAGDSPKVEGDSFRK